MPDDLADVVGWSLAPDRLTLITIGTRPGVTRFLITLEHQHFPPSTARNAEFQLILVKWPDDGPLLWYVVIVPLLTFPEVRRVAAETGMRVADGVPTLLERSGVRRFPIDHGRAFTIENDLDSPLYYPHGPEFILEEERRWIAAFHACGDRLPTEA